jgi:hypothetical protein
MQEQCVWMFVLAYLSRVQVFRSLYLDHIKPTREAKLRAATDNAEKIAVELIQDWWYFRRLNLKISRHQNIMTILRTCFRFFWKKIQIRQCYHSVVFIKKFCADTKGNTKMKRIYLFRAKIIKIQKWFRSWLHIQETRMQSLQILFERIGKKRIADSLRAARLREQKALKSMSESAGFGDTLNRINRYKNEILDIVSRQDREREIRQQVAESHRVKGINIKKNKI